MKIVILDGGIVNPGDLSWEPLEAYGEVVYYADTPDDLRLSRIGDAEIVLINRTPLPRPVLTAAPNLRLVALFATGYNGVDIAAARERGITVCNVPHYSSMAVAQHTLALLLHAANRVAHHDGQVKAGRWTQDRDYAYREESLIELSGMTAGLIGFGGIGQAFAAMLRALGMTVLATRRTPPRQPSHEGVEFVPLDTLLSRADVISLHVPLTAETQGIINAPAIDAMRPGVIILNTSRGALVETPALAQALHSGKVAVYATDVTAPEPPLADDPLLHAPNCVITPHVAWSPRTTRRRLIGMVADNVAAFFAGQPKNIVSA